jgi:hypothetical protein
MGGKVSVEMSMVREIKGLRKALQLARERLVAGEEDFATAGGVVARLTDSLGRALVAQRKLVGEDAGLARLRSETDRLLRELGLGEG